MSALTERDRQVIANARQVIALKDTAAICRHAGAGGTDTVSVIAAFVSVFGTAQWLLGDLVAIVERLAGEDSSEEERGNG